MAVAIDAVGSADTRTPSGAGPATFQNLTVGVGSNRALIVTVCLGGTLPTGITCVWDAAGANQAMTLIATANSATSTAQIYGLVAPVSGNKIVTVSWTGTAECYIDAISFTGVDQTGGATSFPNAANATGASSVVITSAVGDFTIAAFTSTVNFTPLNATTLFLDNTGAIVNGAANYATGAATVTLGSAGAQTIIALVGTDIAAAAVAAGINIWPYSH